MRTLLIPGSILVGLLGLFVGAPILFSPQDRESGVPRPQQGLHISQTVVREVDVPLDRFNAWLVGVKLEAVLPGSALIPRVTGSSMVSGVWGEAGAIRRVHLADGSTALEQIAANQPPRYFAYRVRPERGPAGRLILYIAGEFHTEATPDGGTRVEWRYALKPRTRWAIPHALVFSWLGVRPFLDGGIDAIRREAEAHA